MCKSSIKNIYCSKKIIFLVMCAAVFMPGCGSVREAAPVEYPVALLESAPETADPRYRYAGTSAIAVKPGSVRTIAVSYHFPADSDVNVDDKRYVWTATDPAVVSIRGMGNKCAVVGKREGSTLVVVTNPDIPLPYAFRIICTADEAVEKTFQRTRNERTEGRLVGGWSNLELVENWGD